MNTSNKRSKKSNQAKPTELSELAQMATRALAKAQRQAARENARFGLPLIVVENGRIVAIPTVKAG